ncbi:hydrogenase maturation protease [Streptomyces sp. NPDC048566]|uniref:hydrogenase maturation protease n=1 Tax=Streptomyces sp. NPDC048566 TaxID=3365569 RepID=UPI00371929D4
MTGPIVVIGIGNPLRGDDGVGPAVVEALRGRVPSGTTLATADCDPGRLMDLWAGADTVVVVEALRTRPSRPGTLHVLTPAQVVGDAREPTSTHGFRLGTSLALAGTLGRLPPNLVVHAMEVADTEPGHGLGEQVRAALPELTERVAAAVRRAAEQQRRP